MRKGKGITSSLPLPTYSAPRLLRQDPGGAAESAAGHGTDEDWGRDVGVLPMIERYVMDLREVDQTQIAVVGGKAAHLGELSRIDGVRVPAGFCVTTAAFRTIMAEVPAIDDRLSRLHPDDRESIRTLSAEIRRSIEAVAVPDDLAAAITGALGEHGAHAVRSSATAEDLPTASFAGQQDSSR